MIMRDSEIKTLFAKADEQVHVDEIRKQKTYYAMIEEMEKQGDNIKNVVAAKAENADDVYKKYFVSSILVHG